MSTLLVGIVLGLIIAPLGFGLVRGVLARVAGARPLQERAAAPTPATDQGQVEADVYHDLYDESGSGLVERVPR